MKFMKFLLLGVLFIVGCSNTTETNIMQNYQCDYDYSDENSVVSTITLTTKGEYVTNYRKTDKLNVTSANYSEEELEEAKEDIANTVYDVSLGDGITVDANIIEEDDNIFIEYYIDANLTVADIQLLRYSNLVDEFDKENNTLSVEQLKAFFETNRYTCNLIEDK